jgi:lactoylglutathione lyase
MISVMPSDIWRWGVEDIYKTCDDLWRKGAKIVREPGPMKHGGTEIAFIEDHNGI